MPWLSIAVIVYGIAVAGGGAMGFIKAHSVMSILTGGLAGVILIAMGIYSKSNPRIGFGASAVIAVALIAFFLYRYFGTAPEQRTMVPFQVIGLSVVMLVLLVVGHFMKSRTTAP